MTSTLILNGTLINEGVSQSADIFIKNGRIEKIGSGLQSLSADRVIDAAEQWVLPGMIDDQVHFRDPGFPEKGTLASESKAAVAGGTTSYMEMPNTRPKTITKQAWEDKMKKASQVSWANYGFYFGATNDNIEEVRAVDPKRTPGIKVFMGASTGNMLVDNPDTLKAIFKTAPTLITTHCEDTPTILKNEEMFKQKYGEDMPIRYHADIRSREACLMSSKLAVSLAKESGARLHILHLSTADEMSLLEAGPLEQKRITGEVCVHHLFFSEEDYDTLGTRIKWNPSVKKAADREALRRALAEDRLDVIATDHAPHTKEEKSNPYWSAPSGGPLVQHSLSALLELASQGVLTLEQAVAKACHAPARLFQIPDRGYLREGYWADVVVVDPRRAQTVTPQNILYQCGWSPFEGHTFPHTIACTFVNGVLMYDNGEFSHFTPGKALAFHR